MSDEPTPQPPESSIAPVPARRGRPPGPPKPIVETVPLLEQMRIEWVKLCAKDGTISQALKMRTRGEQLIERADNDVRFRMKQLRRSAVETIQRRHGIKRLPGAMGGTTRKDIRAMSDNLRKLIEKHGYAVPRELGGQ